MIAFFVPNEKAIVPRDLGACAELAPRAVWIDLFEPSRGEEVAVEAALGIEIPTRAEMQKVELSRRLYVERDAHYMTATILTKSDSSHPESSGVTFILAKQCLVTVRYTTPTAFEMFRAQREANVGDYPTSLKTLEGLLDATLERMSEVLEATGLSVEKLSVEIFREDGGGRAGRDYKQILKLIGRSSDIVARSRESLVSLGRMSTFFRELRRDDAASRPTVDHLAAMAGDLSALGDYATFIAAKTSFLLDATLGLINNEQNAIIKLVSVFALVFGPPTLIASIYGMNFDVMPELRWHWGYPAAAIAMAISAVVPYWLFKRRGWL